MAFAVYTKVPIQQTRNEIEKTVEKAGATHFASFIEPEAAQIAFRLKERNIRFKLPMSSKLTDQVKRSRWRALLLVIKAKLEGVEAEIETIEEAFLAHIVVGGTGGRTVYEEIQGNLALGYQGNNVQLLPSQKEN